MNEKKMHIIESGMKLIVAKGYHTTSIQEIATEAGISKGAFYLYFHSKEEFIATAFSYFHTKMAEQIKNVKKRNLSAKQSLAKQITVVTKFIYKYRGFIILHFREDISFGKHTEKVIRQIKLHDFYWMKDNIQAIYGEKIKEYLMDSIIQFSGLLNGYFQWIVMDSIQVDENKMGAFLVERLDNIVQGMLTQNEGALVLENNMPKEFEGFSKKGLHKQTKEQQLANILLLMKEKITMLHIPIEKRRQLLEVIDVLLKKDIHGKSQHVVIQGLLAHFQHIPTVEKQCKEIATLLQIDLLD